MEGWQLVGRLRPETVQNPTMAGRLSREIWWNRGDSNDLQGSVRIARNLRTLADGTEEIESIEVIARYDDGVEVPFAFSRNDRGEFGQVTQPKTMQSCYACHLWSGGISMEGYKPSPDWYINSLGQAPFSLHILRK